MTRTEIMTYQQIKAAIPEEKRIAFTEFLHEMNRREYEVRFLKTCSFDDFKVDETKDFGYGFSVDGRAVPYFHPNRSFHDEIIWLNDNIYYNDTADFNDRLINSAIVKFYGPSRTLELITEGTEYPFIKYDRLINDKEYLSTLMHNIEGAVKRKNSIYGTTELRTSLQTESRNYARKIGTPVDISEGICESERLERKSRPSDMIYWFLELGPKFVEFYSKKPTLKQSFEFLTSFRGIGNYYGYHFSTNLARMPELGTLVAPWVQQGNIDEDDTYVMAGGGAMDTISWLMEGSGFKTNSENSRNFLNQIRNNQDDFFDFTGKNLEIKNAVFELGYLTNFGCEISCCQFSVFRRIKGEKHMASNRAKAPISKEGVAKPSAKVDISKTTSLF